MSDRYNLYNLEAPFKEYLLAGNQKPVSVKNYLSDFRHFAGWIMSKGAKTVPLQESITLNVISEYKSHLSENNIPHKTINRRLSTIRKFCSFCISQGWLKENPAKQIKNIGIQFPIIKALLNPKINKWSPALGVAKLKSLYPGSNLGFQQYIGLVIVLIFISVMGAGIYNQFFVKNRQTFAYPTTLTKAGRVLSFQGRLTDTLSNPITTATNVQFNLYTVSTGGTSIYSTGTCSVTPDQDGVFSSLIGSGCGTEIASSVFSENANVYLGLTVGADSEMTPRQQIANVGYAINTETLQGLPPGANTSNIPYINAGGNLLIAAANPGIRSTYTSTDFTLSSAKATFIQAAGAGDVILQATESGTLRFRTGGATDANTRVTIDNDGNVGIGTIMPTALLEVNGALKATSFNGNFLTTGTGTLNLSTYTLTVAGTASITGTNTGDNAANSSTMYIGTTAHALNRASAAEDLAGITSLTPGADFTISQNSVAPFTSVSSGALANTLYLKAGNVGIGTTSPGYALSVNGALALYQGASDGLKMYPGDPGLTGSYEMRGFGTKVSRLWIVPRDNTYQQGINIDTQDVDTSGGYAARNGLALWTSASGYNPGTYSSSPMDKFIDAYSADGNNLGALRIGTRKFTGTYSGTEGNILFYPGNTFTMTLTNGGNVGIGTTSPSSKLEVDGTAWLRGGTTTNGLFVDSSGNVGIGTTAPQFNWHMVTSSDPNGVVFDSYGASAPNFIGRRANGTVTSPTAVTAGDALMILQGRGYGATGFSSSSRASIRFYAAETWTDSAQGTYFSFTTTPTGSATSAEVLRVQPSGGLSLGNSYVGTDPGAGSMIINGNVGIGTTAPNGKLSIADAANNTSLYYSAPSSGNHNLFLGFGNANTNNSSIFVSDWNTSGNAQYVGNWQSSGMWGIGPLNNVSNNILQIGNTTNSAGTWSGTQNINVVIGGNVGIGTTGPTKELELHGNRGWNSNTFGMLIKNDWGPSALQIDAGTKTDGGASGATRTAAIDFKSGGTSRWGIGIHPSDDTNTGFKIWEAQAGDAVRFMVDAGGNVGIGTTTPAYPLDVVGDIRTSQCLRYNGGTLGTCSSDIRLKTDIQPLVFNDALAKINGLLPKTFEFIKEPGKQYSGLIAQDVEIVAPELVVTDKNGYKQVKYGDIQWLTLEAIKEQQGQIASLSAQLNATTLDTTFVYDGHPDNQYSLQDSVGNAITASIANLRAGFIQAEKITTKTIQSTNAIFETAVVKIINSEKIVSPIVETTDLVATGTAQLNTVATNTIKPQSGDLTIDLSSSVIPSKEGIQESLDSRLHGNDNGVEKGALARLIIKGLEGKTVTTIDAGGNVYTEGNINARSASFSGQIVADSLQINKDATVAGTLTAKEINAENIDKISADVRAIQESPLQNTTNINDIQKLLADIKKQPISNPNYYQNIDSNVQTQNFASLQTDLLTVTGQSNLYNVSVSSSLLVGTTLIDQNSIISLASELKLSALSQINLFDGAVIIAKDGTITSKGEIIAQGGIRTNEIKALTDSDKVTIDNLAVKNLTINNSSTNSAIIAAPDNFTKNGLFAPAIETATASAGVGILPENSGEVVIYNDNVKDDSLIYLTPTSSTNSVSQLTVGEKSIGAKSYFKVVTNTPSALPIKFNWLLVN